MSYWHGKIRIGSYEFPRFIGGPLDGITDSPFRKLVRQFSTQELLYTEMRHVGSLAHDKGASKALCFEALERPLNFQIAANKLDFIPAACERILERGVDIIDLNVGCPANNVIHSGSGSALMGDIPRLKSILTLLRKSIPIPFTIKIRAGFKCTNALEVAQLAQDCGIDALAIHPRLQTQKFEGHPDYELVAQVKKALQIPVIVSGGIVNWATAKAVYEQTGVDGYLIGRGIWARPWKLRELQEHSLGNTYTISRSDMSVCAIQHLDAMISYYGPHGLFAFRKHLPFYLRGIPEASRLRKKLVVSTSVEEVKQAFTEVIDPV